MGLNPNQAMPEAWKLFQSGEHVRAESLLMEIVKESPRHLPAIVALGMVAGSAGRREDAISRMREALRLDKNCLPALKWLCRLCIDEGRFDEAVDYGKKAVQLAPKHPESLQLLGTAYFGQKAFSEALVCFDKAVASAPNVAALHSGRAEVLEKLTRETQAVEALKVSTRLEPSQDGYVFLARLEVEIGRIGDAIKHARKALSLSGSNPNTHAILARALTEAGQLEAAELHWAEARALRPDSARISVQKASALNALGRFELASRELYLAIEQDEREADAYYLIVSSKKVSESDRPLIEKMERVLASEDLSAESRISFHYSLGKSYDNLADYGLAMHHFDEANALEVRLSPQPFDKKQFKEYVDLQISTYTPSFFARFRDFGYESRMPVFVIGMMRSGTTLAEQMLSSHSQIGGAGEQAFWNDQANTILDWSSQTPNRSALKSLGNEYLQLLSQLAPGHPFVIDKNPGNLMVVGALHLVFPNAQIVHMRRHPIDTLLSIWMTPMRTSAGFVGNRENMVFAYGQYLRLMDHWRSVIPRSHFLDVDYESLVENPEAFTRQMADALGLEWEEACIHPERNHKAVRTPSFWQVRQPLYKTSTERWRRYEPYLGAFRELANS